MLFNQIFAFFLILIATVYSCPSSFNVKSNETSVSFQTSETLLVVLSKSSFKLTVIDLITQKVQLESDINLGSGLWRGAYETLYFGYMFRVGIEEKYQLANSLQTFDCYSNNSISFIYQSENRVFNLTFSSISERSLHLHIEVNLNEYDTKPYNYVFPFISISFKTIDRLDSMKTMDYEDFYGFGQYWGFTRYRGQKLYCWSEDGSWSFLNISRRLPQANASYIPMPLFISNRGYAVYVNETRRVNFELGLFPEQIKTDHDSWTITTEWNSTNIQFYFPNTNF
ncbi:unnamed protein product, partial [Didymodactylos carnosus]